MIYLDSLRLSVFQSLNQFNIIQHVPLRCGQLTKESILEILQQSLVITERKCYVIGEQAKNTRAARLDVKSAYKPSGPSGRRLSPSFCGMRPLRTNFFQFQLDRDK